MAAEVARLRSDASGTMNRIKNQQRNACARAKSTAKNLLQRLVDPLVLELITHIKRGFGLDSLPLKN
jgi:hypothetical protein